MNVVANPGRLKGPIHGSSETELFIDLVLWYSLFCLLRISILYKICDFSAIYLVIIISFEFPLKTSKGAG